MIVPFIAVSRYFVQNRCKPNPCPKKCRIIKNSLNDKLQSYKQLFIWINEDMENSMPSRRKSIIILLWTKHLPVFSRTLKSNSVSIAKHCLEQVEFVVAQRIRRGQQMMSLYNRLWDEKALRFLLQRMRRMFQKRVKHFMLGGSAFVVFDWENERIPIEEMKKHVHEMDICKMLRTSAVDGNSKGGRVQTSAQPECNCAECSASKLNYWEPFIIEEDLTVWKMKAPNFKTSGLYCYKLYGRYKEVTPNDFLEVFLDTENRTKWDTHAAMLKVIDSDPSSQSDVIYWETRWPTLFSNRDYVFKRRYYKDEKNKVIIIMNKSTKHPSYPPTTSKARVTEYWSYMVIKASTNLDEPGMEFSLTYFDNPGISLPSAISLWVTVQGMPEYLKRLKVEALAISKRRKLNITDEESPKCPELKEEPRECDPTPPSPPPASAPDRDPNISTYDLVFIFSSYFQKIRATLWL